MGSGQHLHFGWRTECLQSAVTSYVKHHRSLCVNYAGFIARTNPFARLDMICDVALQD
jgi:hypothetical protein